MAEETQRRGSLCPNLVAKKAFPEERVVAVTVAAARAATRVVRGLVVARVASRALAMRVAASTVTKAEAVLEDQVAAKEWVVMVEATGVAVETRVARASEWEAVDMRAVAATVEAVEVVAVEVAVVVDVVGGKSVEDMAATGAGAA